MADIYELERIDAEIVQAERAALRGIAEQMRQAIRDLPSESKLGRVLLASSRDIDAFAGGSSPALWGASTLERFVQDLRRIEEPDEDLRERLTAEIHRVYGIREGS